MRHGVGCADNQHCCPHDAPICDTDQGVCTSEDGKKSVPWTTKVPASYTDTPKPLPEEEVDADDYYVDAGVDVGEQQGQERVSVSGKAAMRGRQQKEALRLGREAVYDQAETMAVV